MKVTIPEWGGVEVTIQKLDVSAVVRFNEHSISNGDDNTEDRAKTLAREAIYSIVDESTGELMFQDTPEDIAAVLKFSFDGLATLDKAITEFNRINIEAAVKNSAASQ